MLQRFLISLRGFAAYRSFAHPEAIDLRQVQWLLSWPRIAERLPRQAALLPDPKSQMPALRRNGSSQQTVLLGSLFCG